MCTAVGLNLGLLLGIPANTSGPGNAFRSRVESQHTSPHVRVSLSCVCSSYSSPVCCTSTQYETNRIFHQGRRCRNNSSYRYKHTTYSTLCRCIYRPVQALVSVSLTSKLTSPKRLPSWKWSTSHALPGGVNSMMASYSIPATTCTNEVRE